MIAIQISHTELCHELNNDNCDSKLQITVTPGFVFTLYCGLNTALVWLTFALACCKTQLKKVSKGQGKKRKKSMSVCCNMHLFNFDSEYPDVPCFGYPLGKFELCMQFCFFTVLTNINACWIFTKSELHMELTTPRHAADQCVSCFFSPVLMHDKPENGCSRVIVINFWFPLHNSSI